MVSVIFPVVLKSPVGVGCHMPRDRCQHGWVHEVGKHTKKWRGDYYVYERLPDGREKRKHRSVILGLKCQMKKWEAEKALRDILLNATAVVRASEEITVRWFWENKYWPMHQEKLKPSSREGLAWIVNKHILPALGSVPLAKIDRFTLQMHLNTLGKNGYGESVLHKVRTYTSAILDEAFEQGLIGRNPARKLDMPAAQRKDRPFLSSDQVRALLNVVSGRDRLILRLFVTCDLRPGELFVLRWDDWTPGQLRIDEAIWRSQIGSPKTRKSLSVVFLPPRLEGELAQWREESCAREGSSDFIFPLRAGKPVPKRLWLEDVLRPAIESLKIHVDYRILRTTFSTLMQKHGTVKDIQQMMRHASPNLTVGTYMQAIPESVKEAVGSLEKALESPTVN